MKIIIKIRRFLLTNPQIPLSGIIEKALNWLGKNPRITHQIIENYRIFCDLKIFEIIVCTGLDDANIVRSWQFHELIGGYYILIQFSLWKRFWTRYNDVYYVFTRYYNNKTGHFCFDRAHSKPIRRDRWSSRIFCEKK